MRIEEMIKKKQERAKLTAALCAHYGDELLPDGEDFGHGWHVKYAHGVRRVSLRKTYHARLVSDWKARPKGGVSKGERPRGVVRFPDAAKPQDWRRWGEFRDPRGPNFAGGMTADGTGRYDTLQAIVWSYAALVGSPKQLQASDVPSAAQAKKLKAEGKKPPRRGFPKALEAWIEELMSNTKVEPRKRKKVKKKTVNRTKKN